MANVPAIGNIVPSLASIRRPGAAAKCIMDLVFRDCALIMESSNLLFSPIPLPTLVPLPIIGFSFDTPEEIVFARYTYATYPYLNKAVVANSFIKEVCPLKIRALRPIQRGNPVVANYLLNHTIIRFYIERYADRGGLFALNTMWGYIGNLALKELRGVKVGNSNIGGVGFEFEFERLNFSSISVADKITNSVVGALGV